MGDIVAPQDVIDLAEEERLYLEARRNSHQVANRLPRGEQRLGVYTVMCFIVNRMIGTGIFNSPVTVIRGTQSVGVSLLFWSLGAINAVAVTSLYIEFGLTVPRYEFNHQKVSVPRNGGELNYLNYLIQRPPFLASCVFGFTFILLGTTAGNALSFGDNVLINVPDSKRRNDAVRGIAIALITFCCLIHGTWRKGGILLNNFIASIKLLILCIFPVLAVFALAGFRHTNHAKENMTPHNAFANAPPNGYGWVNAMLPIIFAYNGYNQANYILSEIDRPRERYALGVKTAVGLVVLLYMLTNISYMIVVSKDDQLNEPRSIALAFFRNFKIGDKTVANVYAAFTSISSFGNIVVMTFTAARVKQEIAKEGVLPFAKFFGESKTSNREPYNLNNPNNPTNQNSRNNPNNEPTPTGALFLHWSFSVLLVLATFPSKPLVSYRLLTNIFSYTVETFFSFILGVGMLSLRFAKTSSGGTWKDKSSTNNIVSIISALVCVLFNGLVLASAWIPPDSQTPQAIKDLLLKYYPWWLTATVGWSVLACSIVYWLVVRFVPPRFGNHRGLIFNVGREPCLHWDHGYPVQYHEIVTFSWQVRKPPAPGEQYQMGDTGLPPHVLNGAAH